MQCGKLNAKIDSIDELLQQSNIKYALLFLVLFFSSGLSIGEFVVVKLLKYIFFTVTTVAVSLVMIRRGDIKEKLKGMNILFVGIMILSLVSVVWSISRGVTLKSSIFLIETTIIAMYIGMNYSKKEIFEMLFIWFCGLIFINALLSLLHVPGTLDIQEMRYDNHPIKGIFKHRNLLGLYSVLGISISAWFYMNNKKEDRVRYVALISIVLGIILIYLAKSMTSMVLLPFIIILMIANGNRKVSNIIIYITVPLLIFISYLIIAQPTFYVNLLESMGRNATLTNRTVIWKGVIAGIQTRPLLGYGYSGFFTNNYIAVSFVAAHYGGFPSHCHNGFLELLIDFGAIGGTFIISMLIVALNKMRALNKRESLKDNRYLSYIISFTVFILFFNLIESPIVKHFSAIYILIVIFFNILDKENKNSTIKE